MTTLVCGPSTVSLQCSINVVSFSFDVHKSDSSKYRPEVQPATRSDLMRHMLHLKSPISSRISVSCWCSGDACSFSHTAYELNFSKHDPVVVSACMSR
jgi:hypothetical protein